jgi:2-succinyl-5-enolpyruvyl-6-hydroxy-3-cyclohexene-1-carboxylate synthase
MIHHLQHIVDLVEICLLKGIVHIVISPGSRNTPLIRKFTANQEFKCHSIVDERSAAFYALGISLATGKPVALICTSGTAVLNYAPALAEAFYQHVPLIAITADRPANLIDQQDNQTIHQKNVYQNYIKGSICLNYPIDSKEKLELQHIEINKIIDFAVSGIKGPVHINVPVEEPLYEILPKPSEFIPISTLPLLTFPDIGFDFINRWNISERRIILCGQNPPDKDLQKIIDKILEEGKAIVLAEPVSNIKGKDLISCVDRIMMLVEQSEPDLFQPDLLISLGGQVVSKRLKQWLQKQPNLIHWRIAEEEDIVDTYQNRKAFLKGKPAEILNYFSSIGNPSFQSFLSIWKQTNINCFQNDSKFFKTAPFSDSSVFNFIVNNVPQNATLHFGNSSPIRYGQMYDCSKSSSVYSNRGVSGIDGCLSTASGIASENEGLQLVIIGDLGFIYDSNALWNRNLSPNLRIILINNQGGGIFRLISDPAKQDYFDSYIEAHHPVDFEKLASAFGIKYSYCNNLKELKKCFPTFIDSDSGAALLEIMTPKMINAVIFMEHIKSIKNNDNT